MLALKMAILYNSVALNWYQETQTLQTKFNDKAAVCSFDNKGELRLNAVNTSQTWQSTNGSNYEHEQKMTR